MMTTAMNVVVKRILCRRSARIASCRNRVSAVAELSTTTEAPSDQVAISGYCECDDIIYLLSYEERLTPGRRRSEKHWLCVPKCMFWLNGSAPTHEEVGARTCQRKQDNRANNVARGAVAPWRGDMPSEDYWHQSISDSIRNYTATDQSSPRR